LDCFTEHLSGFINHYGFTLAKVPNQHGVIAYGYVDQLTGIAYNDEGGITTLAEPLPPNDIYQWKTIDRLNIRRLLTEVLWQYNEYTEYGFSHNYQALQKCMESFDYKIVTIVKPDEADVGEEIEEFGYYDAQTQKAYDTEDTEVKLVQ
jgi:hypothetical protein